MPPTPLNASGVFTPHQEKAHVQTPQLLTQLGGAGTKKTEQDSQQPRAEISPTTLLRGCGFSPSTMAKHCDHLFQGRSLEGIPCKDELETNLKELIH